MISWALRHPDGWVVPLEPGALLILEETREYEISCEGVSAFECFFDGIKIEPNSKGSLTIRPSWVANSELRLVGANQSATCPVRVQPNQEKLSDALWVAMVSDLENWLSGISVGIEGGRAGSVGREGVSLPFIIEALTPLLATFERSLRALLENPRQRDISTQKDVPLRMVRRVDRETLHWISSHPHVQDQLDPWKSLELHSVPSLIPQRWTVETNDHPANRYISWLVRRVESTLRSAEANLLNASSRMNITEDSLLWCRSRAENLRDGANRVNKLWKHSFLSDVQREPPNEAALQVILDDPTYLRVHQVGRLFLNPLFQFDVSGEHQAAVRPSYSIYEIWAFLAVSRQLRDCLSGWTWQACGIKTLLNPCSSGEGVLFQAKNSTGEILQVLFNATFSGYFNQSKGARWSISGERRPDIMVSYKPSSGEGRWLCFDAKYRVGRRNIGESFSSVHIYRDALRVDGFGGKSQAVLLLSPSKTRDTAEWFSESYIQEYGAGVWELKPGVTSLELGVWITTILGIMPQNAGA